MTKVGSRGGFQVAELGVEHVDSGVPALKAMLGCVTPVMQSHLNVMLAGMMCR